MYTNCWCFLRLQFNGDAAQRPVGKKTPRWRSFKWNERLKRKHNFISYHTNERLDWSWKDISKDWREMEEKGLESIEPDNLYQMRINLHPFSTFQPFPAKKTNVSLIHILLCIKPSPPMWHRYAAEYAYESMKANLWEKWATLRRCCQLSLLGC